MDTSHKILLFKLGKRKFAFNAKEVHQVIPIIEITPVPDAPKNILGVINVHGDLIAVGDLKRKLNLTPSKFSLDHKIIILKNEDYKIAFVVDELIGYKEIGGKEFREGKEIHKNLEGIDGVIIIDNEIILIKNIKDFYESSKKLKVKDAIG